MTSKPAVPDRAWTARELRKLSAAERDRILADAAARGEAEYRAGGQLIDFEAFGEDDLHGASSATPAG